MKLQNFLFGLLFILPCKLQATEFPEGVIGKRLQSVIMTITSPIENNFESFAKEHMDKSLLDGFSLQQHKAYFSDVSKMLTGYSLDKIEPDGPDVFYVNLKSTTGNIKRYLIEFNPNPPHRLVGIQESEYVSYDGVQIADYGLLNRSLQTMADNNKFSGNLLIVKDGEIKFNQAYGYADKRFDVKNTQQTRFNLASISKDFVSIGILQLLQIDKLKLQDKIGKFIPELPAEKADQITIHQLLQHRSGLGHYHFNQKFERLKYGMNDIEDYIDIIAEEKLKFTPGSAEDYSNSGFELLAVIIQRASGMNFYEYVSKHIFAVAAMEHSDYIQPTLVQKNLARNYTNFSPLGPEIGYLRENTYVFPSMGSASGGAIGSVGDMLSYLNALETGKLLDVKHMSLFFNNFEMPKDGNSNKTRAGAGGAPGVSTFYITNPKLGVKIIMLSNYDERLAENLAIHLYKEFKKNIK